jgi:hypothetical protein
MYRYLCELSRGFFILFCLDSEAREIGARGQIYFCASVLLKLFKTYFVNSLDLEDDVIF